MISRSEINFFRVPYLDPVPRAPKARSSEAESHGKTTVPFGIPFGIPFWYTVLVYRFGIPFGIPFWYNVFVKCYNVFIKCYTVFIKWYTIFQNGIPFGIPFYENGIPFSKRYTILVYRFMKTVYHFKMVYQWYTIGMATLYRF